ncbi:MAG: transcriptional regulator, MarR family [Candidatus Eremiobacteraeota bacterium]|nr:transcriptional regulator, MarR family [Candidatus Eremiobacteraeota bacterium]
MTQRRTQEVRDRCCAEGYPEALITCPDFVLSTLAVSVTHLVETAIEPLGLRMRHYRLLRMLLGSGPQRQSAVGAALGIDRTSVVALIDEIEAGGLVRRERDPEDRRAYVVVLTAKGRRAAQRAVESVSVAEAAMFGPLTVTEKNNLQNLATRLLAERGPIADRHREESLSLRERGSAPPRGRRRPRG